MTMFLIVLVFILLVKLNKYRVRYKDVERKYESLVGGINGIDLNMLTQFFLTKDEINRYPDIYNKCYRCRDSLDPVIDSILVGLDVCVDKLSSSGDADLKNLAGRFVKYKTLDVEFSDLVKQLKELKTIIYADITKEGITEEIEW